MITHPLKENETQTKTMEQLQYLLNQVEGFVRVTKFCHWNVKGPDFFDLHEQFEKLYQTGILYEDTLAERIVALGGIAYSHIPEKKKNEFEKLDIKRVMPAGAMVQIVLDDLTHIIETSRTVLKEAQESQDVGLKHILEEQLVFWEQKRWMLSSFHSPIEKEET